MPPGVHKRLKFIGVNDDKTMNDLILHAVEKYLSEYDSNSEDNPVK